MKRVLSLMICVVMLFSLLSVCVLAEESTKIIERPAGYTQQKPMLEGMSEAPDMKTILTKGLTYSTQCSDKEATGASGWKDALLTENQLKDIADTKYGISAIGFQAIERPVSGAIDQVWTSGNDGDVIASGARMYGALNGVQDGKFYNAAGVAGSTGKADGDYIYQTLLTFNFGEVKTLTSFGIVTNSNATSGPDDDKVFKVLGMFQAADIYVSNDGVNWTLIGYYDQAEYRLANGWYKRPSSINANALGADKIGGIGNTGCSFWKLPDNTSAQYLRLAATVYQGKTASDTATKYSDYMNDTINGDLGIREIMVFGDKDTTTPVDPNTPTITGERRVLGEEKFTNLTAVPDMTKLITGNLSTAPYCSVKSLLESDWKQCKLPADQIADIANHLKYGFSVVGFDALERSVRGGIDHVWASGNVGNVVTSGSREYGACAGMQDGNRYNVLGEAADEETANATENGFIYQALYTFNFGTITNLTAFGYATNGTNQSGMIQAADIYVSNNGTDWTLVGGYDRTTLRMEGKDYTPVAGDTLGPDEWEDLLLAENQLCLFFGLPENTSGQFLRIACTSLGGKSVPTDPENYDCYVNGLCSNYAVREIMVFGERTDTVGHEFDPEKEDTPVGNAETEEVTLPPIVTKPPKATAADEPQSAPVSDAETEAPAATGAGCKSVVGGLSVILIASLAAVCVVRRKEQ